MTDKVFEPLWGAPAIAAELFPNTTESEQKSVLGKTYYMLEKGLIPARKVGASWVAERSKLRAFVMGEGSEQAAMT